MVVNIRRAAGPPARATLCLLPAVAVAAGLYAADSAWAALLLYHSWMVGALLLAGRNLSRQRRPTSGDVGARTSFDGSARPPAGLGAGTSGDLDAHISVDLFRGWSLRTAAPLLLIAAANGPAFIFLWRFAAHSPDGPGPVLAALGLSGIGLVGFALWYCTVHPLLEEAYWRGLLGSGDARPVAADAAFAAYHVLVLRLFLAPAWTAAAFVILTATAWGWRRVAQRYGGLAIPAASHAAAGVSTMAAVFRLLGGG